MEPLVVADVAAYVAPEEAPMITPKRIIKLIVLVLVLLGLDYVLPDREIVRIVGTDVVRKETSSGQPRDVRFINAEYPDGSPRVYRNEDAPWYLKFDSGNLQARAQAYAKADPPKWVAVKHYGWRIPILSMYPNAISLKEVPSPDVRVLPWERIVFAVLIVVLYLLARWWWRRFRREQIDPVLDEIEETIDDLDARSDRLAAWIRVHWHRFIRWLFGRKSK